MRQTVHTLAVFSVLVAWVAADVSSDVVRDWKAATIASSCRGAAGMDIVLTGCAVGGVCCLGVVCVAVVTGSV